MWNALKRIGTILLLVVQIYTLTTPAIADLFSSSPIFVVAFIFSVIVNIATIVSWFFTSRWWPLILELLLLIPLSYVLYELIKIAM